MNEKGNLLQGYTMPYTTLGSSPLMCTLIKFDEVFKWVM